MPGIDEGSLRSVREDDLDFVLEWRNSERIRNSMLTGHLISKSEHYEWFRNLNKEQNLYLLFGYRNCPAGLVYFNNIDKRNSICEWGFYMGKSDLPRGTGLLMGYLGLEHIFAITGIRKVCSEVLERNRVSIKYHMKLGFYQEGYLVKHIKSDKRFEDLVIFALFKGGWEMNKPRLRLLFD